MAKDASSNTNMRHTRGDGRDPGSTAREARHTRGDGRDPGSTARPGLCAPSRPEP